MGHGPTRKRVEELANLQAVEDDTEPLRLEVREPRPIEKMVPVDPFAEEDIDIYRNLAGLHSNFRRNHLSKAAVNRNNTAVTRVNLDQAMGMTGYGIFDVVQPPYNLEELAMLFDQSGTNHGAILAKVANIVGLGYDFELSSESIQRLEEITDDKAKRRAQRRLERLKNEMEDWLESLNPDETFTGILEKVYTDVESTGNGYIEVGRTVTGEIGYMGHIPSPSIRIRRKRDGFVQIDGVKATFFRNFQDTTSTNPVGADSRPNEIIHIKKYSPRNSYYGVPDTVSVATPIVGNELAAKYNMEYFENKAVPRYIITVKGANLSPQSEDRLFRFLQTGLKGQNHRTLLIPLPGDTVNNKVEFNMEAIEADSQEGSFHQYGADNLDAILIGHQVPRSKVGGTTAGASAASLAEDRTFKEQVCRPAQRRLEKVLNRIIKEQTVSVELKLNELTLTDELTQAKIDQIYLLTNVLVPNEARARMHLPLREDGDEPFALNGKQQMEAQKEQLEMKNKQAEMLAEQKAQIAGTRARDKERSANTADDTTTTSGRAPKGSGRQQR